MADMHHHSIPSFASRITRKNRQMMLLNKQDVFTTSDTISKLDLVPANVVNLGDTCRCILVKCLYQVDPLGYKRH